MYTTEIIAIGYLFYNKKQNKGFSNRKIKNSYLWIFLNG